MDVKPEILPEHEGMHRNLWQLTTITTRLCTQQRTFREYRLRISVVVVSYFRFFICCFKVDSHKGSAFAFFFDLCRPILQTSRMGSTVTSNDVHISPLRLQERCQRSKKNAKKATCELAFKGSFTPSDDVAVTVTLTGGAFHLDKQIKGAARQCYGHRYVIARCEWTLSVNTCCHGTLS